MGLGLMGAALASQLARGGHKMTVWNRSPEKMKPFLDKGAEGANNVVEAIMASPVVLICVEDYAITKTLFESGGITPHLKDRIIVQLSTGTPNDAAAGAKWFSQFGARYIDGAILGGPGNLATDYARVILGGPEQAFREAEPQLSSLCSHVLYLGENIRAASALDLAWLCRHYGMFMAVTHGAVICEAEGVSLDLYAQTLPETEHAHAYVNKIHHEDYLNTTATLSTWATAFHSISRQAIDSGINNEVPQLMSSLFDRALKAGHGDEDVTALFKTMRKKPS
jgi:3-hydroxyisobutyrate dehydrogenase-like beta-hydroxyacid dehydrogenase